MNETLERTPLESFARKAGADVFGVADIARFHDLPPEKHPNTIFPEVRSVVVLGRRITRGTLRGTEEGTNFESYGLYGRNWLDNRIVSLLTFQVAEYIEDNRWEAVPIPNLPPEVPPLGVAVRSDQPPPNVMLDFDDAAVRAGVGEMGYCGVMLTPEFGPRQRIQVILTDAQIAPSPILSDDICPRKPDCKDICPLGAFVGEKEAVVCGKRMKVAEIDDAVCARCKNGAINCLNHPSGRSDRIAAVCIRTCVDCLEKSGRVSNQFKTPFRIRPPWQVEQESDFYKVQGGSTCVPSS